MTDDSREQGVEFGGFDQEMESIEYPIDNETVVEEHGDAELELPDGTTTVGEVLDPLQDDDQTYQDGDELRTMIKNMVGDEAIGRKHYSDRGSDSDSDEESL